MANNRKCSNGHEYDADIYGDKCPFCPPSVSYGAPQAPAYPPYQGGERTQMIGGTMPFGGGNAGADRVTEETMVMGAPGYPNPGAANKPNESHTRIVHLDNKKDTPTHARRCVGVLASYSHNSAGDIHKVCEGVNTVGRATTCSIAVTKDDQMSSKHFSITYRPVDNTFFIRDEGAVNGTYLNNELLNLDQLYVMRSGDVIKSGVTEFTFLAIPQND